MMKTLFKTSIQQPDLENLWHIPEQLPHPTLAGLLARKNQLIVLRYGRPPYRVVLGVPHHVPSGVWWICEERLDEYGQVNGRKGDDNVASFALVAFSRLRALGIPCKLVIMAHATTHDPNKVLSSPYCREIFSEATDLLFECHASSGRRLLELELSAGSNPLTSTLRFGRALAAILEMRYLLGVQTISGRSEALIFQPNGQTTPGTLQLPATKTTSLTEAGRQGIEALHLEAKPHFRFLKERPHAVTPDGVVLGRAVAAVIAKY